jgi:hypothetical protein
MLDPKAKLGSIATATTCYGPKRSNQDFGFTFSPSTGSNDDSRPRFQPWAGYPEEGLSTANSGLRSAPRWPQARQANFGSRSDSRTSSDHWLASIVTK